MSKKSAGIHYFVYTCHFFIYKLLFKRNYCTVVGVVDVLFDFIGF